MEKLAIFGGTPIRATKPDYLKWPTGGPAEEEALMRVLQSGQWGTLGPENRAFAEEYAIYCHAKRALPVLNGTVSLELILRALGIRRGDEVIVPPYTFTATVTAVAMVGAVPVFADIDEGTYTMSAIACERAITDRTRAVIAVHLGGRPADMDALSVVCEKHNLPLIEDAAHAHGSEWKGRRAGSMGRAGSFSFQASKNISCGEGGCITTNDEALYELLWSMHHNGRNFGDGSYEHPFLGTNARLAEWQCAVLRARMQRIDRDIDRRMENMKYLDEQLKQFPFFRAMDADERVTRNALHLYVFKYIEEKLPGVSRAKFLRALSAENVCLVADGYSAPIYEMEFLRSAMFEKASGRKFELYHELPNNELAARKQGCWMYHSSLLGEKRDMDAIVEAFGRIAVNAGALQKEGMLK